jgi:hypothetical protein
MENAAVQQIAIVAMNGRRLGREFALADSAGVVGFDMSDAPL